MDEHAAVRSLFFELPSEERMIIAMHLFCGYSSKEIGKLLDLNENTVRSKREPGNKENGGEILEVRNGRYAKKSLENNRKFR